MKDKELVRDMKVQESLGYSDCERIEVRILRGESRGEKSRTRALHFRKADLFRALLGRISWTMTLKRRGGLEELLIVSNPPNSGKDHPNK